MYIDPVTGEVKDTFDAWDYNAEVDKMLEVNDVSSFPFQLSDLKCWMIKRKDGTVYRYQLAKTPSTSAGSASTQLPAHYAATSSASRYASCHHDPAALPVFEAKNVQLFIADFAGARAHAKDFDVVIDGGNVLSAFYDSTDVDKTYKGDKELVDLAREYDVPPASSYRMLKIDWADRDAPPLYPHFWPQLADKLVTLAAEDESKPLRVLTVCYGGHGRSGTALVSLMMCLTNYTPLDAITHLRAVHCARAIESKIQHEYLNWLGEVLGREQNALEAEKVKSFRTRFLEEMKYEESIPYQSRLQGVTTKEMPRDE